MIKAVLFDNDGVISETEVTRFKMLKQLAEEKGYHGLDESKHLKVLIGKSSESFFKQIFGDKMDKHDREEIIDARRKICKNNMSLCVRPIDGIKKVTDTLAKKYKLAVCSTATRSIVQATLAHLGIEQNFTIALGREDTANVKPDPEIYLNALRQLKIKNNEAVAVEDSDVGIESAKRAHIKVIALVNKLHLKHGYNPDLTAATEIIENLNQLPKAIDKMELIK